MFKNKLIGWAILLMLVLSIICIMESCSIKEAEGIKVEKITHGDLSKHFSSREFVCKCCGEGGAHPDLIVKLEKLRTALGNKPIKITSGYRCAKHNKEVGGVKNSYHLFGAAADIIVEGVSPTKVSKVAKEVGFTFTKVYKSWTHIDIR